MTEPESIGRICPPRRLEVRRVGQHKTEEVFDLAERQDYSVRVSVVQVLMERQILTRHDESSSLRPFGGCLNLTHPRLHRGFIPSRFNGSNSAVAARVLVSA
jgi:hypothetical protein